ncbi:hypothetical protein BJ878DRAFT_476362 [Calycina marina]|uniref:Uncharacterized protein n=1 Tax=Calycina marina TaxID=1763456 RepID=A0A9P7ZBG7_9HELO|nr:hypothetical protein BJ878DRAFT_476362 [Calycina marina]
MASVVLVGILPERSGVEVYETNYTYCSILLTSGSTHFPTAIIHSPQHGTKSSRLASTSNSHGTYPTPVEHSQSLTQPQITESPTHLVRFVAAYPDATIQHDWFYRAIASLNYIRHVEPATYAGPAARITDEMLDSYVFYFSAIYPGLETEVAATVHDINTVHLLAATDASPDGGRGVLRWSDVLGYAKWTDERFVVKELSIMFGAPVEN